jgi:hypothetical protein
MTTISLFEMYEEIGTVFLSGKEREDAERKASAELRAKMLAKKKGLPTKGRIPINLIKKLSILKSQGHPIATKLLHTLGESIVYESNLTEDMSNYSELID